MGMHELSGLDDVLTRLPAHWHAVGVLPRPGASEQALAAFEWRHGVALPADVAAFYRLADGLPEGVLDDELIRFWPLDELRAADGADDFFLFADWSYGAHRYAVRLGDGPDQVALVADDRLEVIAGSFREFLEAYLQEAPSLFGAS